MASRAAGAAAEGRAEVRVCVDDSGKVIQDPQITRSSGDAQFDTSALSIAKAGSGYYRPAAGCLQLSMRNEKK